VLVANASNHDVDLDSGRVLAPMERADIESSPRHDQMLEEGLLAQADPPAPQHSADAIRTTKAPQTFPAAAPSPVDGSPATPSVPVTPAAPAAPQSPAHAPAAPAPAASAAADPAASPATSQES
jgi:hypothetical protein